jgi:hypothetical protein
LAYKSWSFLSDASVPVAIQTCLSRAMLLYNDEKEQESLSIRHGKIYIYIFFSPIVVQFRWKKDWGFFFSKMMVAMMRVSQLAISRLVGRGVCQCGQLLGGSLILLSSSSFFFFFLFLLSFSFFFFLVSSSCVENSRG